MMRISPTRLILLGTAWVATTLLAGCRSTPTRLFSLDGVDSTAARSTYSGPPVRVDAVHVPPALDRIEVVRDLGGGEIHIDDLNHWSAPLTQMARQALSADLMSRLPEGRVVFPHLPKPNGARGITVDVLDLQLNSNELRLRASWTVTSPTGGTATLSFAELRTGLTSGEGVATARAVSVLFGRLADQIVPSL